MCYLRAARRRSLRRSECLLLDEKGPTSFLRLTSFIGWRLALQVSSMSSGSLWCVVANRSGRDTLPYYTYHLKTAQRIVIPWPSNMIVPEAFPLLCFERKAFEGRLTILIHVVKISWEIRSRLERLPITRAGDGSSTPGLWPDKAMQLEASCRSVTPLFNPTSGVAQLRCISPAHVAVVYEV